MSLVDKRVLITRPRNQANRLVEKITQAGGHAFVVPTLEVVSVKISDLPVFPQDSIVIFISVNAVNFFPSLERLATAKVIAIGQATRDALLKKSMDVTAMPEQFSSEGLLSLPMLQEVAGKSVFIISGEGGRELLQNTLQARGAHCQKIEVYMRRLPENAAQELMALLVDTQLDYIICTSGESLENLCDIAGDRLNKLHGCKLIVISQRIGKLAHQLKIQLPIIEAKNATEDALIDALLNN